MATKSGTWRIWLSDLLIATGILVLLVGALFGARTALAAGQIDEYRYLASPLRPSLPLPALYQVDDSARLGLSPVSESPEGAAPADPGAAPADPGVLPGAVDTQPTAALAPVEAPAADASTPVVPLALAPVAPASDPAASPAAGSVPGGLPPEANQIVVLPLIAGPSAPSETPAANPLPADPAVPAPAPANVPLDAPADALAAGIPAFSPVVKIAIPALDIERAVVPVGLRDAGGGKLDWDTDRIFASQNRPDLVGQLVGSYSPGQGDNILLIGHNYNQVDWGWTGVFVNIKNLQGGDKITVYTEDGRESIYQVVQVKQVSWRSKNDAELEKHQKFMGPSDGERLTLITCGGANIWPFPARVYVVAEPVK